MWIELFDDSEFPRAVPFLQLLFAADGTFHEIMVLVPDQRFHAVRLGETLERSFLVTCNAIVKSAGDADVKRTTIAAGHDVDSGEFFVTHGCKVSNGLSAVKRGPRLRGDDG